RRRAEDRRLWTGPAAAWRGRAHLDRDRGGDAELHGAGASRWPCGDGGTASGPLRIRGDPVRTAHGPTAVPGGDGCGNVVSTRHTGPGAAFAAEPHGAPRPGDRLPE